MSPDFFNICLPRSGETVFPDDGKAGPWRQTDLASNPTSATNIFLVTNKIHKLAKFQFIHLQNRKMLLISCYKDETRSCTQQFSTKHKKEIAIVCPSLTINLG